MDGVKDERDYTLDLFGEHNLEHDLRQLFSPQQSPHLSFGTEHLPGGSHQPSPLVQAAVVQGMGVKHEHASIVSSMEAASTNGSHRATGVPPLPSSGGLPAAQKRLGNVCPNPSPIETPLCCPVQWSISDLNRCLGGHAGSDASSHANMLPTELVDWTVCPAYRL